MMLGTLEALAESRLDAGQQCQVISVRSAARHLVLMVDDLLDVTQLSAGG